MGQILDRIFAPFRREPAPHTEVRYFAATRQDNAAIRHRKASVEAQLACYVASTTPERRRADTAAYFAVARAIAPKGRGGVA